MGKEVLLLYSGGVSDRPLNRLRLPFLYPFHLLNPPFTSNYLNRESDLHQLKISVNHVRCLLFFFLLDFFILDQVFIYNAFIRSF